MQLSIFNSPLKVTHSFEHTFTNNHIRVTIAKKALLFPIFDIKANVQIGFYYNGPISITADLLVHSNRGAVGKTIERSYTDMLFFPALLPFLEEHVKEIEPIEDMEEKLTNIANSIKIANVKLLDVNSTKQETLMFMHKRPFALWGINQYTTLYINPPLISVRKGDNALLWIDPLRVEFVSKNGKKTTAIELSNPHLILRKLITLLRDTAFEDLFRTLIHISS